MNASHKKQSLQTVDKAFLLKKMSAIRAYIKIFLFSLVCLITMPLQGLGWIFLGNSKFFYIIPVIFYRSLCTIFRIKVKISGQPADGQVLFVGNHLSYIDIPVLGGHLNATFISKADVRQWPILGTLAALGKTIFIERSRNAAGKCIADIDKSLSQGRSLILFPEGTSTNGMDVLPFKSTIFELFLNEKLKNHTSRRRKFLGDRNHFRWFFFCGR